MTVGKKFLLSTLGNHWQKKRRMKNLLNFKSTQEILSSLLHLFTSSLLELSYSELNCFNLLKLWLLQIFIHSCIILEPNFMKNTQQQQEECVNKSKWSTDSFFLVLSTLVTQDFTCDSKDEKRALYNQQQRVICEKGQAMLLGCSKKENLAKQTLPCLKWKFCVRQKMPREFRDALIFQKQLSFLAVFFLKQCRVLQVLRTFWSTET